MHWYHTIIRNSEELQGGVIEQLEKARARLRKVEMATLELIIKCLFVPTTVKAPYEG